MDFSIADLNFNSVETLPDFEARATLSSFLPASGRAAFTVNSASVFKDDVDMVPQGWHELLRFVYQLLADNFATDISLEQAFNTYGLFVNYGTGATLREVIAKHFRQKETSATSAKPMAASVGSLANTLPP